MGEPITFTADVGSPGAGDLTYTWEFDDGESVSGNETTAETVTHKYTDPGRYQVTLTVEDAAGANDTVTRTLRVSGLVFAGNKKITDTNNDNVYAGIEFDIRNNFENQDITITEVLIDPDNDGIERLGDGYYDDNIAIDSTDVHTGELAVEDPGTIAEFDTSVTLDEGEVATVEMGEFYDAGGDQVAMNDEEITLAFRYEIENTKRNYVSEFDTNTGDAIDPGDPPVIEEADPFYYYGDLYVDLVLSDSDGNLDTVTADVLDENGQVLRSESADISGDEASGYLGVGGYDSRDDRVRVTVTDTTGNTTATTVPI
jgi:PKD repeat protein